MSLIRSILCRWGKIRAASSSSALFMSIMSEFTEAQMSDMFVKIGLDPKVVTDVIKNKKLSKVLAQMVVEAGIADGVEDRTIGQHFYTLASKLPPDASALTKSNRSDLYKFILDGSIKTSAQLTAAINYFKKKTAFDAEEFKTECGVGVVVTPEQIKETIDTILDQNKEELANERYRVVGKLLGLVNSTLKWANGGAVKTAFDQAVIDRIGPKGENESAARITVKKGEKKEEEKKKEDQPEGEEEEFETPSDDFLNARDLEWAQNTPEQLARMKEATKGQVITRFPPEPNGYLHIGHAKAMMQNFGIAAKFGGHCIMRFDDTNPDAEEQEYIDTILENLEALGHKPWKVTYSSDYFEELYQLAVKLIRKGKAYVCHQTKAEIQHDREIAKKTGVMPPSPYRNRSVEENLQLFADMRKGKFEENECTLRMKGDLSHPNPNMWDTVFYRIRYTPHPHTGDKWCIYPTYDYTHCIIDSLENITYSMCTLEFEVRRESYFWLLHELDLYKPKVWEYSRLNITNNVLSKRRLRSLVMDNHVNGWDDPRLLTINGLRRRGIPPAAINKFIKSVGVSRNLSTMIPFDRLLLAARDELNPTAVRAMAVLNPLKVTLTNYDANKVEQRVAQDLPGEEHKDKTHTIPFSRVVYIEQEDFMVDPPKDYIRLAPGRQAHLKNAYNITVKDYVKDKDGNVVELLAEVDYESMNKPQAKLHWVAEPQPGQKPVEAEVRLYDRLFLSEDPMSIKEWEKDLNPNSLVVQTAFVDAFLLKDAKVGKAYQFERVGYFVVDPDSDLEKGKLVFNRICPLREGKINTSNKK